MQANRIYEVMYDESEDVKGTCIEVVCAVKAKQFLPYEIDQCR